MGWRQEHSAKQRAAQQGAGGVPWPTGPRFSAAQRFWAAKVVASDGRGGFEDHWCMLQLAVQPKTAPWRVLDLWLTTPKMPLPMRTASTSRLRDLAMSTPPKCRA